MLDRTSPLSLHTPSVRNDSPTTTSFEFYACMSHRTTANNDIGRQTRHPDLGTHTVRSIWDEAAFSKRQRVSTPGQAHAETRVPHLLVARDGPFEMTDKEFPKGFAWPGEEAVLRSRQGRLMRSPPREGAGHVRSAVQVPGVFSAAKPCFSYTSLLRTSGHCELPWSPTPRTFDTRPREVTFVGPRTSIAAANMTSLAR